MRSVRRGVVAIWVAPFALAGVVVAAILLFAGGGGGGRPARLGPDGVAVRGDVTRGALFGDQIDASVDALVDTRRIDADSVYIAASFAPYLPVGKPDVSVERIGPLERVRWHVQLNCLIAACLPPNPIREGRRLVLFHPAQLRFHTRGGAARSTTIAWPTLELASRFTPFELIFLNPFSTPPFHASDALTAPTYRVSPALLEGLAAGAGGLLVLLAGALIVLAAARRAPEEVREIDPRVFAAMSPLERAALVLELARRRGVGDRRKALERAAQELLVHGDEELGGSARALAWSYDTPTPDDMAELEAAVRRTAGNGRNGDAP
jgi:hypothetical protein